VWGRLSGEAASIDEPDMIARCRRMREAWAHVAVGIVLDRNSHGSGTLVRRAMASLPKVSRCFPDHGWFQLVLHGRSGRGVLIRGASSAWSWELTRAFVSAGS